MHKALTLSLLLFLFSPVSVSIAGTAGQYEQALRYFNQKNYDAAYVELKNLLQNDPENLAGILLLGRLYLANRQFHIAIVQFKDVLAMGGDIEHVLQPMGKSLLAVRQYEEALELGDGVHLSRAVTVQRHLLRAEAHAGLGKSDLALREYNAAVALAPDDVQALNGKASFMIRTGHIAEAEKLLNKSLAINDADYRSWYLQGQIHKTKGQADKAAVAFSKALELNPDDKAIRLALAVLSIEQGQYVHALELIDRVLKDSPDEPLAKLLKAQLLMTEDSRWAKQLLNEVSALLSRVHDEYLAENTRLLFIDGMSQFLLGNYQQALIPLKQYYLDNKDDIYAISALAMTYFRVGRPVTAVELLDQHADLIVQDLDAAVLLCDLYLQHRRQYKCDALVDELDKRYPDNPKVQLTKARALASTGRTAEAIQLLEDVALQHRSDELEAYLAKLYIETNQGNKALYRIRKLMPEHADDPNLLNVLAGVLMQLGENEKAQKVLNRVFALNPVHYGARYNQAALLLEAGKVLEARDMLEPLIYQEPDNEDVRILMARAELGLGNVDNAILVLEEKYPSSDNIRSREMLLILLKNSGQYDRALAVIKQLLEAVPLSADYLKEKAEIHLALGDQEHAQSQLNALFGLWREEPEKLVELSRLQRRAGDKNGARKSIGKALELAPDLQAAQVANAELYVLNHDASMAAASVAELKEKRPNDAAVILIEAELLLLQGKFDQAQDSYARVFSMDMGNGLVLVKMYNLALLGYQPGLFEQQVTNALAAQPQNHYYRNLYADFLLRSHRLGEARQQYLLISDLEDYPNRSGVLNNLAISSITDDIELAHEAALKAMQLEPTSAPILDTYGWILAKQGKYEKALAVLRRAQALDATDPSIHYHVGYTLYHIGHAEEGKKQMRQAVNSDLVFFERKKARQLLESLETK
jgi:putative PEP-CTERM system TPR-repeat lipoprotein